MNLHTRKFLSKRDLPFFAGAAVLLLLALLPPVLAAPGQTAALLVDGKPIAARQLSQLSGPETLTVTGQEGIEVTVEFSPQGARVLASGCPDQTCVRTGRITHAGEAAVCLPGRVVLRLEGSSGMDAETY